MRRARVAALAVDDHRRGQHQRVTPARAIAASSAAVPRSLWPAYSGRSARRRRADHGRLVADHVDAVEQVGHPVAVAHVGPVHAVGQLGARPGAPRDHGVEGRRPRRRAASSAAMTGSDEPGAPVSRTFTSAPRAPGQLHGQLDAVEPACGHRPARPAGRAATTSPQQGASRSVFSPNTRNTSAWSTEPGRVHPRVEVGDQRDGGVADAPARGPAPPRGARSCSRATSPAPAYHCDSARVENRGPSITTMVPPSTRCSSARGRGRAGARAARGQYGSANAHVAGAGS